MNESDLENELRALRPAVPSPELEARIADEFATLPVRAARQRESTHESLLARILHPLFWASAEAAATVAVMMVKLPTPVHGTPPLAATQPGGGTADFSSPETTRELLAAEQSEVRYEGDQGPVREIPASYLEHHAWTDPRTGGRVEIAIPREDVFLQPIAMQ